MVLRKHFVLLFVLLSACFTNTPLASAEGGFLYETAVANEESIAGMTDKKLLDTYIDVLVDLEASTTFSRTAGFNQKDYYKFKDLIRYRVRLLSEIQNRKLPVPETGSPCYF